MMRHFSPSYNFDDGASDERAIRGDCGARHFPVRIPTVHIVHNHLDPTQPERWRRFADSCSPDAPSRS
jgi:hypothetical protein